MHLLTWAVAMSSVLWFSVVATTDFFTHVAFMSYLRVFPSWLLHVDAAALGMGCCTQISSPLICWGSNVGECEMWGWSA